MGREPRISVRASRRDAERQDVESRHRAREALEGQRPDRLALDKVLNGRVNAGAHEDLARVGLVGQARGKVRDRADRCVVEQSPRLRQELTS